MALHRARGIEVISANPQAVKQFAAARMQRSKTDLTAAAALHHYPARMPRAAWQPPAADVRALRGIVRRITAPVVERTQERKRRHAVRATAQQMPIVVPTKAHAARR